MRAAAHSPSFAKKIGIPQPVAREFVQADKGLQSKGTDMKAKPMMMDKAPKKMMGGGMYASGGMPMVEKDGKKVPAFAADGKGKMAKGGMSDMYKKAPMKKMAAGGLSAGHKAADGVAKKGKTKAMQVKMRKGGSC
jgi:hypothetical protein